MRTFEIALGDGLSKLRDSILLLTRQQEQALESSQEGCRGMDKKMSKYKEVTNSLLVVQAH
jgi:hypothetical protein